MATAEFESLIQFILSAPRANGSRLNRDSKRVCGVLDPMRVDQHLQCSMFNMYGIVSIQCATIHVRTIVWINVFHYNGHGCELYGIVFAPVFGSMCSLCSVQYAIYGLLLIKCATMHASARIKECAALLQVFSLASRPIYNILVRR